MIEEYLCIGKRITSNKKLAWYFKKITNNNESTDKNLLFTGRLKLFINIGVVVEIEKTKDNQYIIRNKFIDEKKSKLKTQEITDNEKLEHENNINKYEKIKARNSLKNELKDKNKIENLTLKELKEKFGGKYFINIALKEWIENYLRV